MAVVHAIIPHHRGPEMLAACLESLESSTGIDLRVVVVANGRDAELPAIARELERVSVVESDEPLGFSTANNLGVEWAQRELGKADDYFFVNNDVVVEPDALERLVEALEETGAKIAGPLLLIEWARDHINSLGLNVTEDAWGWDEGIGISLEDYGPLPERREVLAITGSALLMHAGLFDEVGGWTELYDYYFEDIDLCLKARRRGERVIHVPEAVGYHHISASVGLGSERKDLLFWRNRLLLALVHWPEPLLLDVVHRAVFDEILAGSQEQTQLQRRALQEAFAFAPEALEMRSRQVGKEKGWTRFLRPVGSVPEITLPEPESEQSAGSVGDAVEEEAWLSDESASQVHHLDALWRRSVDFYTHGRHSGGGRRILVLGCSPLPFENERMNYAPGSRTWQFASALAEEGHRVLVACARIPGAYSRYSPAVEILERESLLIYTFEDALFFSTDVVEGLVNAFAPEILVGASARPSRRAVQLAGDRPVWVDVFGDVMAEGQAFEARACLEALPAYRDLLVPLLLRGDAFSAVSERQRYSLIGQLGLSGRLNRATAGQDLVTVVPCCAFGGLGDEFVLADRASTPWGDDFVVLWGGGFNTWCDIETLVAGVNEAMDQVSDLRLVVTGGAIAGHDERSYESFRRLVLASPHHDRFVLKGSVETAEARQILAWADVGVVTELPIYERELGSSGRIVDWLAQGLPVVCTTLSEIGETVNREGMGFNYRHGDSGDLARAILEAHSDRGRLREMSERSRDFARTRLSPASTTAPLVEWARAAYSARDRAYANPLDVWTEVRELRSGADEVERMLTSERQQWSSERTRLEDRYHALRSDLGEIHQSKMWKAWMFYLTLGSGLRAPLRWVSALRGRDRSSGRWGQDT